MGTDIHMAVERFDGKKWNWTGIRAGDEKWGIARNYDLFSVLANVRNGVGFAGVKTGAGFIPIGKPRGFPNDVDPRSIDHSEEDRNLWYTKANGDHDASWILLSELVNYDLTQKTLKTGAMKEEAYLAYRECGDPVEYCGDVRGKDVFTLEEPDYEAMVAGKSRVTRNPNVQYYIQTTWEVEYSESVGDIINTLIKQLLPLGDPKLTRLVFNFDS
jgi:hypothetical protein